MIDFDAHLVPLVANVGMLALLAWGTSLFGVIDISGDLRKSWKSTTLLGLGFGAGAALLMHIPIEFEPGIIGDARGAPLMMAGVVGGPVAAILSMLVGGAMRWHIGGVGALGGTLYVIAMCSIGAIWGEVHRRRASNARTDVRRLILLALAANVATTPVILLLPESVQYYALVSLWPKIVIATVVGVAILATLIRHEESRRMHEVELEAQKEAARAATLAKSRFIAAISHDIRTPMNGILGVLQMADRYKIEDEFRSRLEIAKNSGFYLLSLINQVLDFSRIESDRLQYSEEEFTLGGLASDINAIFGFQFEDKGVTLVVNAPNKDTGTYLGDVTHIRQILFNLVGNALKYTDEGKVTVFFDVVEAPGAKAELKLIVQDEGIGIPEKDLNRIFDEFAKASNARGAGTGLGLSIVSKIVQSIGGSVDIESVVGLGTQVTCKVPILIVESDSISEPEEKQEAQHRSAHVLVAEDNPINQMIVESFLTADGHGLKVVENGKLAVAEMRENPEKYDLILMDIMMPVLDGVEATREIRKQGGNAAKVPILALTANAFDDQKQEYLSAGMQDVLTKPIKQEVLIDAIQTHLGLNNAASDTSVQSEAKQCPNRIDYGQIKDLVDLASAASVAALAEKLDGECRRILGRIEDAFQAGESAARPAHELKGMALGFGMKAVADLAKQIETADAGQPQNRSLTEALKSEVQVSIRDVQGYIDKRLKEEVSD